MANENERPDEEENGAEKEVRNFEESDYNYRATALLRTVASFIIGIAVIFLVGNFLGDLIYSQLAKWVVWILLFFFSIQIVGPEEEGVPMIFGQYVNMWGYRIPPGISLFWPWPIGGSKKVTMIEQTVDHSKDNGQTIELLSHDNVKISLSFISQWHVFDSLRYSLVANPTKTLGGILERTARWYVTLFLADDLPNARQEASKFISGQEGTTVNTYVDDEGNPYVRDDPSKGLTLKEEKFDDIRPETERLGIKIDEVYVDDFGQPPEMTEARAAVVAQQAVRAKDETRMSSLVDRVDQLRKALPEGTDAEFLVNTAQTLQGDASKIVKDVRVSTRGKVGEIVSAAAILPDQQGDNR